MAFKALFDVSLVFLNFHDNGTMHIDLRQAPQDRDNIVRELIHKLLCVLWCGFGILYVLRKSARDLMGQVRN